MGAERDELGAKRLVGAKERLGAHRRGDVGFSKQQVEVDRVQDEHCEHAVGAVDEAKPFFRLEDDGRQPGAGKQRGGWSDGAVWPEGIALTRKDERAVGERREIAATSE